MPRVNFVGGVSLRDVTVSAQITGMSYQGTKLYVGFAPGTTVTDRNGSYTRDGAGCLDLTTGLWTSFNPLSLLGSAYGFASDGTYLYLGGTIVVANPSGAHAGETDYLMRFDLATGLLDQSFDLDLYSPGAVSGYPPMPFVIGSTLYLAAHNDLQSGYYAGTPTLRGALSSVVIATKTFTSFWPIYNADPLLFVRGGYASHIIDLGSNNLLCFGNGLYCLNGSAQHVADYILSVNTAANAGVGSVSLQVNGYGVDASFRTLRPAVVGSRYYLSGYGTGVKTLPGSGAAPGSRVGMYAAAADGTWDTSFSPVLGGSTYEVALESYGSNLFLGGLFTSIGGDAAQNYLRLLTPAGAVVSSFNPTFSSCYGISELALCGSKLAVALSPPGGGGNVINGSTISGTLCFMDPTSGALV